ncbi:unnamed protein product, partial [Polarella glacialis]
PSKMAMSRSPLLATGLLAGALLVLTLGGQTFLQPMQPQQLRGATLAAATIAGAMVPVAPALAGEPPSVGEHWYWNLGIGQLHGETASIIFLVFGLLVIFSLLGMGGSSRKSSA